MSRYTWHGKPCSVLVTPAFRKGAKRNGLIQLETGEKLVIPFRALRRVREINNQKEPANV